MCCRNFAKIALAICCLWLLSGCSVYMASTQPDKKDLNVFEKGTERSAVIAEIGAPATSKIVDGKKVEIYRFTQGYSSGAKTGRAIGHGVADIFTLGLWEVVGTPTESIMDGTEMAFEIVYSTANQIETVRALTDAGSSAYENSNPELQDQLYRRREIGIASELCGDQAISRQFQDMPTTMAPGDIPEGYAIVVGSAYMDSTADLPIWPKLEIDEGGFRYPAAAIFTKVGEEEVQFMVAGPRTHIYVVPVGSYIFSQTSGTGYSDLKLDTEEFVRATGTTGVKKDVTGMLVGVMNVSQTITDTVYTPATGTLNFIHKSLGGKEPSEVAQELLAGSTITLKTGEIVYIGHIQLYTIKGEQIETAVIVNNEFERAKSELKVSYPEFVDNIDSHLLNLKQTARLD